MTSVKVLAAGTLQLVNARKRLRLNPGSPRLQKLLLPAVCEACPGSIQPHRPCSHTTWLDAFRTALGCSHVQPIGTEHAPSLGRGAGPQDAVVDRTGPRARPMETSGLPGQSERKQAVSCSPVAPEQSQSLTPNTCLIPIDPEASRNPVPFVPLTGKPSQAIPWHLATALLGLQQAIARACHRPHPLLRGPRPAALSGEVSRFVLF